MNAQNELASFEHEILAAAKSALNNPKLRKHDIHEWAFGEVNPVAGEVVVKLESIGCHICIPARTDKRQGVLIHRRPGLPDGAVLEKPA